MDFVYVNKEMQIQTFDFELQDKTWVIYCHCL